MIIHLDVEYSVRNILSYNNMIRGQVHTVSSLTVDPVFSYSLNKHLTDHLIGKITRLDKQTKSWFSDSMDLDQVRCYYYNYVTIIPKAAIHCTARGPFQVLYQLLNP